MPPKVVTIITVSTTVVTKTIKAAKAPKAANEKMSALKLKQKAAGYMLAASNASKK
jgi:hypothetical protein